MNKLRGPNRVSRTRLTKEDLEELKKCSTGEHHKSRLYRQESKINPGFNLDNHLRVVKAEIEREIYERKCVN